MILYLLRHGVAEAGAAGTPDRARALTTQGIARMKRQAAFFDRAGLGVERLFSSPYVRARQTADLVAPALGVRVEEDALLGCGCSFEDALELLGRVDGASGVLFVGHQPDLGQIVHAFTGSTVNVRTGTLVALDVQRPHAYGAVLTGVYDPDVTAHVGHALHEAGRRA